MDALAVLMLSDGRPGHYHLAEGTIAAITRRRPVAVTKLDIRRRWWFPNRWLIRLAAAGFPADIILRLGFGISSAQLGRPDLVVSAGRETLAANIAAAKRTLAHNVFCGSLRHAPANALTLVITSYEEPARHPNHLTALKPSAIERPRTADAQPVVRRGSNRPPQRAGLLIGGDSGEFRYADADWQQLLDFIVASHRAYGTRWLVTTSPRSPPMLAPRLSALAANPEGPVAEFIDYAQSGAGSIASILQRAEAVVCTEDSSTMLSEAISAQLPVVGVSPAAAAPTGAEQRYRAALAAEGWCRSIALGALTPEAFLDALDAIVPMAEPPLERLAQQLEARLPALFAVQ